MKWEMTLTWRAHRHHLTGVHGLYGLTGPSFDWHPWTERSVFLSPGEGDISQAGRHSGAVQPEQQVFQVLPL